MEKIKILLHPVSQVENLSHDGYEKSRRREKRREIRVTRCTVSPSSNSLSLVRSAHLDSDESRLQFFKDSDFEDFEDFDFLMSQILKILTFDDVDHVVDKTTSCRKSVSCDSSGA